MGQPVWNLHFATYLPGNLEPDMEGVSDSSLMTWDSVGSLCTAPRRKNTGEKPRLMDNNVGYADSQEINKFS